MEFITITKDEVYISTESDLREKKIKIILNSESKSIKQMQNVLKENGESTLKTELGKNCRQG